MINLNFSLTYIELYFLLVNIVAFCIYGFDKLQALSNNKNISRVPELKLLLLIVLGGFVGAFISMLLFRHKIKKLSFMLKFIGVVGIEILCWYYIK